MRHIIIICYNYFIKVLESGSHEYIVVTCAVSLEFKSGDEILSLCNTCIVRFSGVVGKMFFFYDDAGPGSILARKVIF